MNKTALAKKLRKLTANPQPDDFIFDLLLAYGVPKSSITILKNGPRNMLAAGGGVTMKRKVFFLPLRPEDDPLTIREEIKETLTEKQRFIVLTDYDRFYGYDVKLDEALDCDFTDLADHYDFFLPWAGIEKTRHYDENPADVKAAGRMAKLFDLIKQENPDDSPEFAHDLNVFLSRVLFCFFAEDTGIFPGQNLFSNGIGSQTKTDGSDLQEYLTKLFTVLDLDREQRTGVRAHLLEFPYVNGGLFRDRIKVPTFSARSRRALIDAGTLDWADINPDIFGSMIQAVVDTEKRGGLGMHYTSVPNIMKVIEPLFLNDLREEFTNAHDSRYERDRLGKLRDRLGKIKIFDPACGSGNFLIIAYKELRKLEMEIIQRQADLGADAGARLFDKAAGAVSNISLNQFYGIEIDDFAHEIAILALWLAEHQMNSDFKRVFGQSKPTLPLIDAGHIVRANACRVDWEEVCPKVEGDETYILGNPPFLGSRNQSKEQKKDIRKIFSGNKAVNSLDYVSCWFRKGAEYNLGWHSRSAFISTNSVCQGEHVAALWPDIYAVNNSIDFARKSFLWNNNAKSKAAVYVVIVGLTSTQPKRNFIFGGDQIKKAKNISPYLTDSENIIVRKRNRPLSPRPSLVYGNQAIEGGNLILSKEEANNLIEEYPFVKDIIRPLYGAEDYMNDEPRYCLWISDDQVEMAIKALPVKKRIEKVEDCRSKGGQVARSLVDIPHRFRYVHEAKTNLLVLPRTTSSRRKFITVGLLDQSAIVTDAAQVIYDPPVFIISLLSSKLHMAWVNGIAGRLKMDPRYSNTLVYNTFPFPPITPAQEQELTETALGILAAREMHPGKTLAELYDPDKMPENLREVHRANDLVVERCYRPEPFTSDEERLAYLFKLYEKMIAAEKEKDTLFATKKETKKTRKKKK